MIHVLIRACVIVVCPNHCSSPVCQDEFQNEYLQWHCAEYLDAIPIKTAIDYKNNFIYIYLKTSSH